MTEPYNPLEYAITVLNMVADGRTTDYDGVPINIQAALAVRELTHGLDLEDDTFICERCACIFDIEESVKPYGKKGPMMCAACAEKEYEVDAY